MFKVKFYQYNYNANEGWEEFYEIPKCHVTNFCAKSGDHISAWKTHSVRFKPIKSKQDFEGDSCYLGCVDFVGPVSFEGYWFPHGSLVGFAEKVCLSKEVGENPHEGGPAYMPPKLKDFKPNLVKVQLFPVDKKKSKTDD